MPSFTCSDTDFDLILAALRGAEAKGIPAGTRDIVMEHRDDEPDPQEFGDVADRLNCGLLDSADES